VALVAGEPTLKYHSARVLSLTVVRRQDRTQDRARGAV